MKIIENLNPTEFTNYLKKYGNTICGRHPIGILLQVRTGSLFVSVRPLYFVYRLSKNC